MSDKTKYIIYSVLDYFLTFGGCSAVIVVNYVSTENSAAYKISLTGIVLICALIFYSKANFERHYREKYDFFLQQLAEAMTESVKLAISEKLEAHKKKNHIYQRLMCLMPFAILYMVTLLGAYTLENLSGTVGLILASLGAGSFFNVQKKPIGDRLAQAKIIRKVK